jgi:hypothetical protein
MKSKVFWLFLMLVGAYLFTGPAFAVEQPALVEQYALGVDAPAGLWNLRARHGKKYRQENTWQEFKAFTCAHSGISTENCTDAYLSNLKKGTVVFIPAAEVFVQVPEGAKTPETISLTPLKGNPKLLVPAMSVALSTPVDNTQPLLAEIATLRSLHEKTDALWKFFLGLSLLLMIALLSRQKRFNRKEHELSIRNERTFALMERVKTITFTMPPFAVHETKESEFTFPVASVDGNGEPFVEVDWVRYPIKLSQLESFMHRAFLNKEVLPHIQWIDGVPQIPEVLPHTTVSPRSENQAPENPTTQEDIQNNTPLTPPIPINANVASKHE